MFSKIKTFRKSKLQSTEHRKSESEKNSGLPSRPYSKSSSGTAKLSQDMATLVNNPQGSDVQFKVGGGDVSILQENGETIYDESTTVTLYAHSVILRCRSRYFATMLDEEKNWKESSKGVIYKPNISPSTFQDVLHYIYTGNVRAKDPQNIIELITAADEMDLEELSTECQTELVRTVKYILCDEDDSDGEYESGEVVKELSKQRIPVDLAISTHIIPALNFANSHSLSHLSQKLQDVMLPHMSVVVKSPNAYTAFIDKISSEDLAKIIASDNLAIPESSIWNLALDWACHQTKLSKVMIEARLSNLDDEEEDYSKKSSDITKISSSQLNQLRTMLTPLLPSIRFSLFDPDEYARMMNTINYFLPRRQYLELQQHFISTDRTRQLDAPRMESPELKISSKIISNYLLWNFMRKNILETGGINGCSSFHYLKFKLLFRASEDGFLAITFHQRCDNKGPTLVLVKSIDGYLFGGVNFDHWKSDNTWSSSSLNLLFTFPDGQHRKNSKVFKISQTSFRSSGNFPTYGPIFGDYDFHIGNSNQCGSNFPTSFKRERESSITLAGGARSFKVSDYEVFAIS